LSAGIEEMTPRIAHVRSMMGVVLSEVARTDEALQSLDESIVLFRPLIEAGRKDIAWQFGLAHMNRSLVHIRRQEWAEAGEDGERAVALFANLALQEPRIAGWQGHALTILAEARFRQGDLDGSRAARIRGFQLLQGVLAWIFAPGGHLTI